MTSFVATWCRGRGGAGRQEDEEWEETAGGEEEAREARGRQDEGVEEEGDDQVSQAAVLALFYMWDPIGLGRASRRVGRQP